MRDSSDGIRPPFDKEKRQSGSLKKKQYGEFWQISEATKSNNSYTSPVIQMQKYCTVKLATTAIQIRQIEDYGDATLVSDNGATLSLKLTGLLQTG